MPFCLAGSIANTVRCVSPLVCLQLSLSRVQLFETPWTTARQAFLSLSASWSLLKFMSTESVMLSNILTCCCSRPLLPSVFPILRVFSNESALCTLGQSIRPWASASYLPMNIQVVSFRIDWFDLITVQGTLKSHLQHHSLKASIVWHLAFFMVQLSHP